MCVYTADSTISGIHVKLTTPTIHVQLFWYKGHMTYYSIGKVVCAPTYLPGPPARLVHKTSVPARQGNIEYIQVYSSIFKYIQGIFKEYLENMSNTPGSCPA
jgi:hypothetical protein